MFIVMHNQAIPRCAHFPSRIESVRFFKFANVLYKDCFFEKEHRLTDQCFVVHKGVIGAFDDEVKKDS